MHHTIIVWTPEEDLSEAVSAVDDFVGSIADENNWFTTYFAINAKDEVWTGKDPEHQAAPEAEKPTFERVQGHAARLVVGQLAWAGVGRMELKGSGFVPDAETTQKLTEDWSTIRVHLLAAIDALVQECRGPASEDSCDRRMPSYKLKKLVTALHHFEDAEPFPFVSRYNVGPGCLYEAIPAIALSDDEEWQGEPRGTLAMVDVHT